MVEDWETGQLYWNSLRRYDGDEAKACLDVKKNTLMILQKTKICIFSWGLQNNITLRQKIHF